MRLAFALTLLPATALACAVEEPFDVSDIALGPVVVAARIAEYRLDAAAGVMILDVAEVWKGQAPARLAAAWPVTMAEQPPGTWTGPETVLAALVPSGDGFDLMVEMCGSAWLVPDTPDARAAIRKELAR